MMRPLRRGHQTPARAAVPADAPAYGWQPRELVVWGAHGGAGTTTLAIWLQPAWEVRAPWPQPEPRYPARLAQGRPLLVACRTTAAAARLATTAVTAVNQQGGWVAVLAVVSDGWPEPATATRRFQLLQPHVGAVVRIPFVPGLRLVDDPDDVALPRRVRRALAQIEAITGRHPTP